MSRSKVALAPTNPYYVWGICGGLLLAIGIIYGQTLGHALLDYDDQDFVYGNPHVATGLTVEGIEWALTDGPGGEWYPLAMLSHMLDCQLFGPCPWGHHLTNVLIHAAATIALFFVWWRFTDELWPSAFVAAIFAVHPQHVESVAWVAERKDVLSGLFFMFTLGAYLEYVRRGRSLPWYLVTAAMLTLGLLAKPMLVTMPALLLLLDFWPLARAGAAGDTPAWTRSIERPGTLRLVLEKLPLFAIALGDALMTWRTHTSGSLTVPWSVRLGNAAVSCVTYVADLFYPADLAAFYPLHLPGGPPLWKVAGAVAIVATVSAAAVVWRRRSPYFFVGWFWYLGMLAPVLGLVKIGPLAMADRYMYLPGIGLSIALAWAATRWAAASAEGRWTLGTCAGLTIVVLVVCSVRQASYWRDDETLWTHALACTTDNSEAEFGLGYALARKGQVNEAIGCYRRAIEHATDYTPFNQLGLLLGRQNKLDEATALFRQAAEMEPAAFQPQANLGMALLQQGHLDEASEHFHRALDINPRGFQAHCGLALLLRQEGKLDEACAEFEKAIAIEPRNTAARIDLGLTLVQQGNAAASIPQFEAVLAIDPKSLAAHIHLARVLAESGDTDQAAAHYRQALAIDPKNAAARRELNRLLRGNAASPSS